ncbi:MAG: nitroreductase family protein [Alphaproteobacteria bacterium]|jgi:nitroreductase
MSVFDLTITDKLLSTTRAVRKRLDLEKPVAKQVITDCLELALQAPTGSNRQGWRWLVVMDAEKRGALANLYRKGAGTYLDDAYRDASANGVNQDSRVFDSARYLAEHLQEVPVHVIPCIDASHIPADAPPRAWGGLMGSIYPAMWSFQLALRARGLGSVLTTLHLKYADDAAKLLGIPENFVQAGLMPVAYTIGVDFRSAKRRPLNEVVHWDSW